MLCSTSVAVLRALGVSVVDYRCSVSEGLTNGATESEGRGADPAVQRRRVCVRTRRHRPGWRTGVAGGQPVPPGARPVLRRQRHVGGPVGVVPPGRPDRQGHVSGGRAELPYRRRGKGAGRDTLDGAGCRGRARRRQSPGRPQRLRNACLARRRLRRLLRRRQGHREAERDRQGTHPPFRRDDGQRVRGAPDEVRQPDQHADIPEEALH